MNKLRNSRGETIAETLVSLTIAAVGLVLLASMINASTKMIEHSRENVKHYVAEENEITTQITADHSGEEEPEGEIGNTGWVMINKKIEIGTDPETGEKIYTTGNRLLLHDDDTESEGIKVEYFVNSQARGDNVKAYEVVSYKVSEPEVIEETEGGVGGE